MRWLLRPALGLAFVPLVWACGARTELLAPTDAGLSLATDGCTTHCSADLHEVLDCRGNVLLTCPADEGCDGTGCSPACLAAQHNQTTVGCEYYAVDPDVISIGVGACFAAFVANTWTTPVALEVDRDGQTFDLSGFARLPSGSGQSLSYQPLANGVLEPGQVAILFLARFEQGQLIDCPDGISPAVTSTDAAIHGTGRGHAFHITASAPVAAYDIFPYGGGASAVTTATLLLPTAPFATNFVAVAPFDQDQAVSDAFASLVLVGTQPGTMVTINPTSAITAGDGVLGSLAGVPTTYTLGAGEELQITQPMDLTGSVIQATSPIAVFAGATCMNIDVDSAYCDVGHQQLPPVRAMGSEYVGVRYRNRYDGEPDEVVPWRFVGLADGTTLTFDPPTMGSPMSLGKGQLVELWAPGPFVVRSQDDAHPFYLSGHMTSALSPFAGGTSGRGDPEFINVIPAKEWLPSYTFFTDPTYPETNLVVVRQPNAQSGYDDVNLDCAGNLGGWQSIGGSSYQYTRIDLVRHDFAPQGGCDNGRHLMSSSTPFALVVWGWGSEETETFTENVSYAYPAGAGIVPINDVVVSP